MKNITITLDAAVMNELDRAVVSEQFRTCFENATAIGLPTRIRVDGKEIGRQWNLNFPDKEKGDQRWAISRIGLSQRCRLYNLRDNRKYSSSALPVFQAGADITKPSGDHSAIFREVCASYRTLTDVRFKLLGLVPAVSLLALISLFGSDKVRPIEKVLLACAGFVFTLGLFIYDRRNSELYDDLISRGRRIEMEMGVDTGHFRGRKMPSKQFITHGIALSLIYGMALFMWVSAIVLLLLFPK